MSNNTFDRSASLEKILTQQAFIKQKPVSATLELLPLCNMNCDMCFVRLSKEQMDQQGKLLTYQQWIDLAKQMQQFGLLFLLITGGEPLLYPHFKELYIELIKMGFIVSINTNGTLLSDTWISVFKKYKPRRINITLYGSNNTTYTTLCHFPNGYTQTIESIKQLINAKIPVKINGSIVKDNYSEMQELYDICNSLDVAVHIDTYMIPSITHSLIRDQALIRLDPKTMAYAELTVLKNEMSTETFQHYVSNTITKIETNTSYPTGINCQAGNTSFAINWKGFMLPCISMKGIQVNLLETSIEEAWNTISKQSKTLFMSHSCGNCKYRPICKTCVATAYLETNHYDHAPAYMCEYAKEFAKLLYEEQNK